MAEKSKSITDLITLYNSSITRAKNSGDEVQKLVFYREALNLVDKICTMLSSSTEAALVNKWKEQKRRCQGMVSNLEEKLNLVSMPEAGPDVGSTDGARHELAREKHQTVTGESVESNNIKTTKKVFKTRNAVEDVPAEVIERWYWKKDEADQKREPLTLEDITGMDNVKAELKEIIENLNLVKTGELLGLKPKKGIFFYGLPGTGKTYLIRAFIGELMQKKGYKCIQLSGGDIHSSLVGVGEKIVKIAVAEAIDNAPCIIFIDEFDSVCANRETPGIANHEKNLTNAFLDAFNVMKESDKNVILLAATNYPNLVDKAMMDRLYYSSIPLPAAKAREQYFERRLKKISLSDDITFEQMSEKLENYSYRDLEKLLYKIQMNLMASARAMADPEIILESTSDGYPDEETDKLDQFIYDTLKNGTVKLTRAMYDDAVKSYTPRNKTNEMRKLEEFERFVFELERKE